MITEEQLFNRELSSDTAKNMAFFSRKVSEMVEFGGKFLLSDVQFGIRSNLDAAATSLYRHCLDLLDSISQLYLIGSGNTAQILHRALWENSLYLDYIYKEDTERRAGCYVYFPEFKKLRILEQYNTETPKGKKKLDLLNERLKNHTIDKSLYNQTQSIERAIEHFKKK